MSPPEPKADSFGASFLPEDYLQRRADRRSNIITLILFSIVMAGVVGAFLVTNRQWASVKTLQQDINREYTAEAKKIDQLKTLEAQKADMIEKAEVTTALIEKVPRSILMAEIINRMPGQLTLTDFKLTGKRIKEQPLPSASAGKPAPRSLSGQTIGPAKPAAPGAKTGTGGAPGAKPSDTPPEPPKPPKFEFTIELVGLSGTDEEVADYHAALRQCPLLDRVELVYSGEVIIDEAALRKFRISAQIRTTADARKIEPLQVPRLGTRIGAKGDGDGPAPVPAFFTRAGAPTPKPATPSVFSAPTRPTATAPKPPSPATPAGVAGAPDRPE